MNALFDCVAQGCIYDPHMQAQTASRVRIAFAAAYPEAQGIRMNGHLC